MKAKLTERDFRTLANTKLTKGAFKKINARRLELIKKKRTAALSAAEARELSILEDQAERYVKKLPMFDAAAVKKLQRAARALGFH